MKRIPKEKEVALQEKIEDQKIRVKAALDAGCFTKQQICDAASIKMWELTKLFMGDKELHAEFKVRRRILVDQAADNIADIVSDKNHPNHFAASKYVLQKYKSDLDTTLEPHDQDGIEFEIQSGKSNKPAIIRFGKKE